MTLPTMDTMNDVRAAVLAHLREHYPFTGPFADLSDHPLFRAIRELWMFVYDEQPKRGKRRTG